jgi:hypothetical protein
MRFYNQPHKFYCGVDLHARTMYLYILDNGGTVVLHKEVACEPAAFLQAIAPYRDGLVVAWECLFCCYWLGGDSRNRPYCSRGSRFASRPAPPPRSSRPFETPAEGTR